MATPSEKLAHSLEALKVLQERGVIAIHTTDLTRIHRERLIRSGFLQEIIRGWYISCRPDDQIGESTAWYTSFWSFCASYLQRRFGDSWCLSPDQSLSLHAGNWTVPSQLLVRTPKGSNKATALPHNTSLFDARYMLPDTKNIITQNGLRLYSLAAALIASNAKFFVLNPVDAMAALAMIRDASDILRLLLEGGHSVVANRLAGAFRHIGQNQLADDILQTMHAAGYETREFNPFDVSQIAAPIQFEQSPYVTRMKLIWEQMRVPIINYFPKPPEYSVATNTYLKQVEEIYTTDAYHSLSIEGYLVSPDLIERVKSGKWNPDDNGGDNEHQNALAARGYWQAFQAVKESVKRVLERTNPGKVAEEDHRKWYREMFGPCAAAGILQSTDLAGYRNNQVYIRRSMHVPPNSNAVRELMPAFFDLLQYETESSVRIVLGHFFFVYIHPYTDGNGRLGRFLMNVMLAAAGYKWLTIPVEQRTQYMAALEDASVRQNIIPFCHFIGNLIKNEK